MIEIDEHGQFIIFISGESQVDVKMIVEELGKLRLFN